MLEVTEEALAALAQSLKASEASSDQGLRLARTEQGEFGLALDEEREGDQVVKNEERPVLLLDQEVASLMDGAILEVLRSPEGVQLTLRLPEEEE